MSYIESNLQLGETIVCKAKIHWLVFMPCIVSFIIGLGILMISKEAITFSYIVWLFGVIILIKAIIYKMTTELAITTKRVIAKWGFISRDTMELNHNKVESFNVSQGVIERIFDCGTVVVNGTGGMRTPIKNIAAPLHFRNQAVETVDASQGQH